MSILTQLRTAILIFALGSFLVACQSGNQDVRDAARENIQSAVQPAMTQTPSATPAAQPTAVPQGPTTEMTFAETTFDFGTITEGEKVSHSYVFKNTGKEPLILSNAKGSCGCTVPKWPREPIAPGESAQVDVVFNSKNKKNKRNQKVTITANTNPPQTFIYLTGMVEPAGGQPDVKVTQ